MPGEASDDPKPARPVAAVRRRRLLCPPHGQLGGDPALMPCLVGVTGEAAKLSPF